MSKQRSGRIRDAGQFAKGVDDETIRFVMGQNTEIGSPLGSPLSPGDFVQTAPNGPINRLFRLALQILWIRREALLQRFGTQRVRHYRGWPSLRTGWRPGLQFVGR